MEIAPRSCTDGKQDHAVRRKFSSFQQIRDAFGIFEKIVFAADSERIRRMEAENRLESMSKFPLSF